jgi:hypothetical protein
VGRNRSLRALVRYSIHQDEEAGRVESQQTSAPPAAPTSGSNSHVADMK